MDFNGILASAIQGVREISAVIVTDDYLCYKEQESPYNFFHILIFTNYLRLKLRTNGNIERRVDLLWTGRTLICCSCSHTDPFAFSSVLPRLSRPWIYFYVKSPERIENFQHVIADHEISWCNSEKLYVQGTEHGLVRHYPVNDGRDQLVLNTNPRGYLWTNSLRN